MTRWLATVLAAGALGTGCAPVDFRTIELTPASPEMREALTEAIARWEAAGLEPGSVVLVHDGAPASFADSTRGPCGAVPGDYGGPETEVSECATFDGDRRATRLVLLSAWRGTACEVPLVTHALGHLLAGRDGHPRDGEHGPGVMARFLPCDERGGPPITGADLSFVCADAPCWGFAPESED